MISHLTKDFYIYTTFGDVGNGFIFHFNEMYLITDKSVVLFDTPWGTTQFRPLLDSIKARHNLTVKMCISTHFYNDRTAELNYYKQKVIRIYRPGKQMNYQENKRNQEQSI